MATAERDTHDGISGSFIGSIAGYPEPAGLVPASNALAGRCCGELDVTITTDESEQRLARKPSLPSPEKMAEWEESFAGKWAYAYGDEIAGLGDTADDAWKKARKFVPRNGDHITPSVLVLIFFPAAAEPPSMR